MNGLKSSGRYPASGRDGWESNPPKKFWRLLRQPWNIRPYIAGVTGYLAGWFRLSAGLCTAWRVRPSGPDRGLHRAAAYVPANTNTNVGTQASTHWRGISLSAPHVGFDCETLEQRNVKGVPRQEHTREATSYLFYISLDNPPGEWVVLWAVVGHSPKGEEKRRSTGKLLPHAPFSHRFLEKFPLEVEFQKFFYLYIVLPVR